MDENDPDGRMRLDFKRMGRAIRLRNPDLVLVQNNYGNLYTNDLPVGVLSAPRADPLKWGVATRSLNDRIEYLYVLRPPSGKVMHHPRFPRRTKFIRHDGVLNLSLPSHLPPNEISFSAAYDVYPT